MFSYIILYPIPKMCVENGWFIIWIFLTSFIFWDIYFTFPDNTDNNASHTAYFWLTAGIRCKLIASRIYL
jgi:hypothetical protein